MFFFIGGIQPRTVLVERLPSICQACGHTAVYLKRVDHYLSLFFIPLFPVKKGAPFQSCEHCHSIFDERGSKVDIRKEVGERTCPYCGGGVIGEFNYCPYCGKAIS